MNRRGFMGALAQVPMNVLPTCGTCPNKVPIVGDAGGNFWCVGKPPTCSYRQTTRKGADGVMQPPEWTFNSDRAPVRADMTGCAVHPDWPWPEKHTARRTWAWAAAVALLGLLCALAWRLLNANVGASPF